MKEYSKEELLNLAKGTKVLVWITDEDWWLVCTVESEDIEVLLKDTLIENSYLVSLNDDYESFCKVYEYSKKDEKKLIKPFEKAKIEEQEVEITKGSTDSKTIQNNICHSLKILPEYFFPVFIGEKKFEVRENDRNFNVGDFLKLEEWCNEKYSGNYVIKRIEYILPGGGLGVNKDYVVISLSDKDYGNQILAINPL